MKRLIFSLIFALFCISTSYATTQYPLSSPIQQFTNSSGIVLTGGSVYTCQAGTTCTSASQPSPKTTYTDSTGGTANTNPIVLDSAGRASIWTTGFTKMAVYDSLGNLIKTIDNIPPTFNYIAPSSNWVFESASGSIAAAVSAIGGSNATLVVDQANSVTANLVVPANVNMLFLGSGLTTISSGKTLTINGSITAGRFAIFAGSGTVTGLNDVYPEWWGAVPGVGSGASTVNTSAIIAAFTEIATNGGTLHINQYFETNARIDWTTNTQDSSSTVIKKIIDGDGGEISSSATTTVLDLTGRTDVTINNLHIYSISAQVGILAARAGSTASGARTTLNGVVVDGAYSIASFASIAAETLRTNYCQFYNTTAGYAYASSTGNGILGITPAHSGYIITSTNTDIVHEGDLFFTYSNGTAVTTTIYLENTFVGTFHGCDTEIQTPAVTAKMVKLQSIASSGTDYFIGAVKFDSCHFEGALQDFYFASNGSATQYFIGLDIVNSFITGAGTIMAYQNVGGTAIKDFTFKANDIEGTTEAITLSGLIAADFLQNTSTVTLTTGTGITDSTVSCMTLTMPNTPPTITNSDIYSEAGRYMMGLYSLSPSGSPYAYQNTSAREMDVFVYGGTVSDIAFSRDGSNYYALAASAASYWLPVRLSPNDYIKVTYSSAPSMVVVPR